MVVDKCHSMAFYACDNTPLHEGALAKYTGRVVHGFPQCSWSVPNIGPFRRGRSVAAHDETLWTRNVVPFLPMTVKGWLWYREKCLLLLSPM